MNLSSKTLVIAILSAGVALAGCTKKPARPTPDQTMLGPAGNSSLNPTDVNGVGSDQLGLQNRNPGDSLEAGNQIRGLLQPVFFDFDRSALRQDQRANVQAAAQYLQKNPGQRLLLEGHCDWRGTEEYNLGLGDRRSNTVKQYLITLGVSADRLETLSKGSLEAVKNGTEAQMAHDRRVELVVLKQ